jgi:hypothetical protein
MRQILIAARPYSLSSISERVTHLPMHYLPARCDACGYVVLVPHHLQPTVLCACPKCDAEVSIFPGAKHRDDERPLFQAMSDLIHDAVEPYAATMVLGELEGLEDATPIASLALMASHIAALEPAVRSAMSTTTTGRLVPMLLTILRARSAVRAPSGFSVRRAVPVPATVVEAARKKTAS